MAGFFFEFEAVRTESRDHDAPRRQSVDEIGDALSRASGDLLRVQRFVGQGGGDGMKQSSQKNAVEAFLRNDSCVSRRPVVLWCLHFVDVTRI